MWRPFLLAALLAAGVRAFAPTPIRWGGISAKRFVLAPSASSNRFITPPKAALAAQSLAIWDQELSSTMTPKRVSYFTTQADKTIAWDGTGMCIEARGDKSGDAVGVDICTGEPKQVWNVLPMGKGQKNQIQLKGTNECIDVNIKEGGLNGALVELQKCDDTLTKSWEFEASFPLPTENAAHWQPFFYSMRDVVYFCTGMAVLGALNLVAWLWQGREQSRALNGQGMITDDGGVSLTARLAAFQNDSPSIHRADEEIVPAVMFVEPELEGKEEEKPSRARRLVTWVGWRLEMLRKSKQVHDAELEEKADLEFKVAKLEDELIEKADLEFKVAKLEDSVDSFEAKVRNLEAMLTEEKSQKEMMAKQKSEVEVVLETARNAIAAARERETVLLDEAHANEVLKTKLELTTSCLETKLAKQRRESEALVSELFKQMEARQLEARHQKEELESLQDDMKALGAEKTDMEGRLAVQLEDLRSRDDEIKVFVAEKTDMEGRLAAQLEDLRSREDEIKVFVAFKEAMAGKREKGRKQVEALETRLAKQKSETKAAVAEKEALDAEKKELEARKEALDAEKKELEARWGRVPAWIKAFLGENDEAAVMAVSPILENVDVDHGDVFPRGVPPPL